ncbi:MAG TPA: class I SAM-dependent methyltransferase [Polyangiales bacterium]|nr:class I SAM-dependent methyltransferase [Polyangiales bacterium]
MKRANVLEVYDDAYARDYDETYISNPEVLPSTVYQLALLRRLLSGASSWLDVACGTGFYLSALKEVPLRMGLDLSASMLEVARRRNPGIELVHGSFLDPRHEWTDRWQAVTCMWWAYCLVESVHEIEQLAANLARWSAPHGFAFIPLCNPRRFSPGHLQLPSEDPARGGVQVTGVTWTWNEANGKTHRHMISPLPEAMVEIFSAHFADVSIVTASDAEIPPGYWSADFLVARAKR